MPAAGQREELGRPWRRESPSRLPAAAVAALPGGSSAGRERLSEEGDRSRWVRMARGERFRGAHGLAQGRRHRQHPGGLCPRSPGHCGRWVSPTPGARGGGAAGHRLGQRRRVGRRAAQGAWPCRQGLCGGEGAGGLGAGWWELRAGTHATGPEQGEPFLGAGAEAARVGAPGCRHRVLQGLPLPRRTPAA